MTETLDPDDKFLSSLAEFSREVNSLAGSGEAADLIAAVILKEKPHAS